MTSPPFIGPVQGKAWGRTRCVYSHNNTEVWEVDIKKGGFCSEHHHKEKWNRFVVSSGKLRVTIFKDDGGEVVDETVLERGMCSDVQPGCWHMFEALEDTEGIEIYWASLDPSDITRRTQGGMRDV